MSQKYLIRIAELERLLSEQAEALRQKDQQLSLVEETEAFLRSALARAEEKIEEDEREIEHLRAQIEKLRRMLFGTRSEKLRREVEQAEALLKQREQESDRSHAASVNLPTTASFCTLPFPLSSDGYIPLSISTVHCFRSAAD
jgi:transposase